MTTEEYGTLQKMENLVLEMRATLLSLTNEAPMPAPPPKKWAAEKEAHRLGRIVQVRYLGGDTYHGAPNPWVDCDCPTWAGGCEYRIKPEPPKWDTEREAWKQGIMLQYRERISDVMWGNWYTLAGWGCEPHWDDPKMQFRIAPKRKFRPFTPGEVPVGKKVVGTNHTEFCPCETIITGVMRNDIFLAWNAAGGIDADNLLRAFTFEDGSPCGVLVEEEL